MIDTRQNSQGSFRPDIEGLRGLAILAVVCFHAGIPGVVGGYIGVDVFYVLSGYLITGLLVAELAKSGTISFKQFYARRARRLAPAFALVLIATLFLVALVNSPAEQASLAHTEQTAAVYLSNLHFAREAIDYFGPNSSVNPYLHTWSLAVEEQFYLVWPLLVLITHRFASRLAPTRSRFAIVISMVAISLASFVLCVLLTRRIQPWAFYASPPRFWEFGIGALATLVPLRVGHRLFATAAVPLVCLAAVVIPCFAFHSLAVFPGWIAAIPVVGTAGLLRAGASNPANAVGRFFGHRAMQWMGRLSYSWYLWHWPLILALGIVVPGSPIATGCAGSVIALGLAMVTFGVIEHPIRASAWLRARPLHSIAMALGLIVSGVIAGQALRQYANYEMAQPSQRRYAAAKQDAPRIYHDGCMVPFLDTAPPHECVYGDPASSHEVVLFGDSHAAQWFEPVERIAIANHWRLVARIKTACAPIPVVKIYSDRLHRYYDECMRWRDATLREILERKPALVIMSAANYLREGVAGPLSIEDYRIGLNALVAQLDAAKVRFVWIADTPHPAANVPDCLSRKGAAVIGKTDCTFLAAPAWKPATREAQRTIFGADRFVDLSASICPSTAVRCDVERGNVVIYRDDTHLTSDFALTLTSKLQDRLVSAMRR